MKSRISRRYLAGLIDGEGYISIRPDNKNGRSHFKPVIKMAFAEKSAYLLFEIKERLGGHIHKRVSKKEKHNDSYCWEVQTFSAVKKVLDYVYPYLILKKEQARLALVLIETKSVGKELKSRRFNILDPQVLDKRQRLYNLVKGMNFRGRLPAETKRETPTSNVEGEAIVRSSTELEEGCRNVSSLDNAALSHTN
jgi:hypothetical protein